MQESKYDHYASMREYTQMDALHQLNDNVMNEHHSDGSDIDIPVGNMDVGRGRKTANDKKQWMFVVRRTPQHHLAGGVGRGHHHHSDESQPLLGTKHHHHASATESLNALHQAQTRSTLEMDIRRTDLHISPAVLSPTVPSPVPDVDFLYVGISEKRMCYWTDRLEYQLNLNPALTVEWLLMIDNQLAIATNDPSIENRQFNLQCWRDLYVRYYSQHVNEEIYKFYRKYGYGYDESYAKDQFALATDLNLHSRDVSQGSIFREVDRIRLTKFSFQSNLSSTMNNGYMSTLPIDQIDCRIKDVHNVLVDAFPCHEYDVLADIYQQIWSTIRCTSIFTVFQIPLAGLRDYYGEKYAYYFLFLVSLSRYMIPLSSVAFFFQIYQFTSGNVEVELIGFFAILVLIWGAIIPLLWRQQESRYACIWGQYSNETADPEHLENTTMDDFSNMAKVKKGKIHYIFEPEMERVEFKGKPGRSTIDGAVIKTDDELDRIKNYCTSWGLLFTVMIAITGLSVTIVIFEFFVRFYAKTGSTYNLQYGSYAFGVLNAICMLMMDWASNWFIPMINTFENHRTNIQHKKALFLKKMCFDFINYYVSLLFIVFVVPQSSLDLSFLTCSKENCLIELQVHFASVYVTLIVLRLAAYLYNFTCGKYSFRKMKRVPSTAYFKPFYDIHELDMSAHPQNGSIIGDVGYSHHMAAPSSSSASYRQRIIPPSRKPELTANEYLLYKYEEIQKPLSEFVIQFGYLLTFGLFFPWCAPISLFYNLLVLRLELHKLTVYSRRPFPEGANGLAPYNTAFKMMTMVSMLVVFYIFTVDSFELRFVDYGVGGVLHKLLDWILLIAIYMVIYAILLWLFPAVPQGAKDHIKRQMFVDQSIGSNYRDMKAFQESITVSSLLRLREWSVQEVYQYFNHYGHPRYTQFADTILKKQIDGKQLLYITKRDLQLFGIADQYHRMWIDHEIENLKVLHRHVLQMMQHRRQQKAERNQNGAGNLNGDDGHDDHDAADNPENIHMDTLRAFMRQQEARNTMRTRDESESPLMEYDDDDEREREREEENEHDMLFRRRRRNREREEEEARIEVVVEEEAAVTATMNDDDRDEEEKAERLERHQNSSRSANRNPFGATSSASNLMAVAPSSTNPFDNDAAATSMTKTTTTANLNPFGVRDQDDDGTAESRGHRDDDDAASRGSWSGGGDDDEDEDGVTLNGDGDYKSLSKLGNAAKKRAKQKLNEDDDDDQVVASTITPAGDNGDEEEGLQHKTTKGAIGDNTSQENKKVFVGHASFGGAQIGRLTKAMAGRSSGAVITLGDIVDQYRLVIKEAARSQLIRNYAAKQQVERFETRQHIYGLLEVVILLVIRVRFKENVDFDQTRFATELQEVVEWMVCGEDTMAGRPWTVDEFAERFDEWISTLSSRGHDDDNNNNDE